MIHAVTSSGEPSPKNLIKRSSDSLKSAIEEHSRDISMEHWFIVINGIEGVRQDY